MKVFLTVLKVLFGLATLSMLGVTIYFLIQHLWGPAVATAALAGILAYFNVMDIKNALSPKT